jgi:hypothetical protein
LKRPEAIISITLPISRKLLPVANPFELKEFFSLYPCQGLPPYTREILCRGNNGMIAPMLMANLVSEKWRDLSKKNCPYTKGKINVFVRKMCPYIRDILYK